MQPVPPKINTTVTLRPSLTGFAVVVCGMTVVGAGAVLYFFNPSQYGFYPVCEFHQWTGLNCPGCGGTRAVYQLLHGHVLRAMQDNALAVLAPALLAGRAVWVGVKRYRRQPVGPFLPLEIFLPLLVVAVVFTILRNLPAFSFLSP